MKGWERQGEGWMGEEVDKRRGTVKGREGGKEGDSSSLGTERQHTHTQLHPVWLVGLVWLEHTRVVSLLAKQIVTQLYCVV